MTSELKVYEGDACIQRVYQSKPDGAYSFKETKGGKKFFPQNYKFGHRILLMYCMLRHQITNTTLQIIQDKSVLAKEI